MTARGFGKRSQCIICQTVFPARGSKRTCSDYCKRAYRSFRTPVPEPKECRDPSKREFIAERVKEDPLTGCWVWQRSLNPQTGYGQIGYPPYTAHKLAYQLFTGTIPAGQLLRHSCHNRACCNPAHLTTGSSRENYFDSLDNHRESARRRRGKPARNRVPVSIGGVHYPSKSEAMAALGVSFATVNRLAKL